jgi:Na+-driven multidrug efflux pump
MSNSIGGDRPTDSEPAVRQMVALWLPLAASIVMMVLEPSIINIGLGRTFDAETALAAYGVAFSLALLVEAPILMLLDASVARSDSQAAFTVVLGLIVTAIGLVFSLTPLYNLVVEQLMNIPPDVAARARPTLQVLSFWPLPIAWRRAHQGVLIRAGRTAIITVATGVRLVSLAGGIFGGLLILPERGALVAGLAMDLSVVIEAMLITLATRPALRQGDFGPSPPGDTPPLTLRELWRFYWPLLGTTILRQSTRPLLNVGIAAAILARDSLAAWPVAWGLATLIAGPAWSLQQLTTALASDATAYQRVRRFSLSLSLLFSVLLALVVFTPLYGLVMGGVYNLSPELQALARPALQIMTLLPLVMGVQSVLRGSLIRGGCTGTVRTAMTLNVGTVGVTLVAGVVLLSPTGVLLAAVATLTGNLAELAWLRHDFAC